MKSLSLVCHVTVCIGRMSSFRRFCAAIGRSVDGLTSAINSNKGSPVHGRDARESRLTGTVGVTGHRGTRVVYRPQFLAVVNDAEEFVIRAAISGRTAGIAGSHGTFVLHVIMVLQKLNQKHICMNKV